MPITFIINNFLRKYLGIEIRKYKEDYRWLTRFNISTVVDIGANEGQFALKFSRILPSADFYCFEPIGSCFKILKSNLANVNCKLFPYALGDENAEMEINVYDHNPSSSLLEMAELHKSVFDKSFDIKSREKISVKILDEILVDKLNNKSYLVKIDVQGFEDKVIKGGKNVISQAKVIIIEMSYVELYKEQKLFNDIYFLLISLGFSFKGNLAQSNNPKNGEVLYSDSIFTK
jgi:FkbM family methyltransferase